MNIKLPKNFIFTDGTHRNFAYIKKGTLYIEGFIDYESLMYTLSYAIYGCDRCYYCGEKLDKKSRTLDHLFPRAWGGISIPDNLLPCCRKCNGSQKGDMTYHQYMKWLSFSTENERKEYYLKSISINRKRLSKGKIVLPQDWLEQYDITKLLKKVDLSCVKREDEKLKAYFNKSHSYCKPIIVSSNGWMFKGTHILCHAKKHGVKYVPAVVLENVVKL